jgi:hypothetical protein
MNISIPSPHELLLKSVAERYRQDGYEVIVEPRADAIPFDLGGYVPDLIVRKGDLKTIVEIKAQAQRISLDHLRSIVEEIKQHQGWRFVLVTAEDIVDPGPGEGEDQFSWETAEHEVEEAKQLSGSGKKEAAFVVLWIALERMMRFQARRVGLPVDRLDPSILIRQLYSQGELSMQQFETALSCQQVRNRVFHAFLAPDLSEAATRLEGLVRELLVQWPA